MGVVIGLGVCTGILVVGFFLRLGTSDDKDPSTKMVLDNSHYSVAMIGFQGSLKICYGRIRLAALWGQCGERRHMSTKVTRRRLQIPVLGMEF